MESNPNRPFVLLNVVLVEVYEYDVPKVDEFTREGMELGEGWEWTDTDEDVATGAQQLSIEGG